MVCHDRRRRRRQAIVQLAPLHSWHHRVRRDRRDHRCLSHRRRHSHKRHFSRCHQFGERRRREQKGRGGLQGRQRRGRAGQVGFKCSNASDGRTGHRCRRSFRISTVPCRSWPRDSFARTVHNGAPSRRARAAIPLEATLRRWYRRRMAPRVQNSPSAVLAASGAAAVAAGGGRDGCLHSGIRTVELHVHFHPTHHRLSSVLHTFHGWCGTLH